MNEADINKPGIRISLMLATVGGFLVFITLVRLVYSVKSDSGARVLASPVDVFAVFEPTAWMGDAAEGTKFVRLTAARPSSSTGFEGPSGKIMNFTVEPGPRGWAGVGWQYPAQNWGQSPGTTIEGAKKLTFWAIGSQGGEILEFKVGGIKDHEKAFPDSANLTLSKQVLTREWKRYEIDLRGQNLSNIVLGFVWISTAESNPRPISFYLGGVKFEN